MCTRRTIASRVVYADTPRNQDHDTNLLVRLVLKTRLNVMVVATSHTCCGKRSSVPLTYPPLLLLLLSTRRARSQPPAPPCPTLPASAQPEEQKAHSQGSLVPAHPKPVPDIAEGMRATILLPQGATFGPPRRTLGSGLASILLCNGRNGCEPVQHLPASYMQASG
eukprot:722695-Rhodomonas_salina.2